MSIWETHPIIAFVIFMIGLAMIVYAVITGRFKS